MVAAACAQASALKSSLEACRPFTPPSAAAGTPVKLLAGGPAAAGGSGGWGPLVVSQDQMSSRGGWLGRSLVQEELVQVKGGPVEWDLGGFGICVVEAVGAGGSVQEAGVGWQVGCLGKGCVGN